MMPYPWGQDPDPPDDDWIPVTREEVALAMEFPSWWTKNMIRAFLDKQRALREEEEAKRRGELWLEQRQKRLQDEIERQERLAKEMGLVTAPAPQPFVTASSQMWVSSPLTEYWNALGQRPPEQPQRPTVALAPIATEPYDPTQFGKRKILTGGANDRKEGEDGSGTQE